jgi:hypothetical protein
MYKHHRRRSLLSSAVAGGVLLALSAGPAAAADWSVNPDITASYEYNDNTRMSVTSADAISVSGAAIDAAVELRADTPRGYFRLLPRVRSTFFPSNDTEETDSQWVDASMGYDGERSTFDLRANYSRVETLGAYLPGGIGDPGGPIGEPDPGDGTGGSSEGLNREDRFLFAPEYSVSIKERHGVKIGAGYVDSKFDQQVANDREDYEYVYGTLGYVFRMSPSKTLTMGVQGSKFEDEDGLTTGAREIVAEWRNRVSETSEFYARAGANQSEDDAEVDDPQWDTGFSGGIGVRWSFEVSQLYLDLTSDLDPNASGRLVQRDQLRFRYDYRLTPTLDLITGARVVQDAATGEDDEFEEREYANASIGLAWRFTRQWTLGGAYTYVWSDFENDVSSAEANRISIGITYEPNRL